MSDMSTPHTPALSVVMPAYNAMPYLERAVGSILDQTLTDLELIIVDDGSTDRTWEIVEELAAGDARIRPIRSAQNEGEAVAFNKGAAAARAPIIGRMDSDDISMPDRFEKQLAELLGDPDLAVLGSFASHTNDREEILSLSRTGPTSTQEFNKMRERGEPTMVFGGTAAYRKELFELVGGYDSGLSTAADLDFCDRMADHGVVRAIPEPLLLYRVHHSSNVMRRFFDGRRTHRYVRARRAAANRGDAPISRDDYIRWEHEQSLLWRFRTRQDDVAQYHYRAAGIAFANRHRSSMVFHIGVAVVADPSHVLKRLWSQRLGPAARRARRGSLPGEDSLRR
ncbi:MAG: glycosyltransferase family 2 protein [bacterium]|nr:glycosyltransferase family 2 protein [bacterium]